MAPMSQEQLIKAKLKMRDRLARLILWKLGEMHEKYAARPRTQRACKELRAARQMLSAAAADPRDASARNARQASRGTPARKRRSFAGRETTDRDQERLK